MSSAKFAIFKALVTAAGLPETPLCYTFNTASWVKRVVDTASSLCSFSAWLELEQETCANLAFFHVVWSPEKRGTVIFKQNQYKGN